MLALRGRAAAPALVPAASLPRPDPGRGGGQRPAGSLRKAPVNRDAVQCAWAELQSVAERLGAAGPVDVRGVARISGLLTDGTGPLYRASPRGRPRDELRAALGDGPVRLSEH